MSVIVRIQKNILDVLKKLPKTSGVYLFRDAKKAVLYIGRATSLRSRVSSYFVGSDSRGERIFQMVDRAKSIKFIETETVLESVILEANLIKEYQPKYNIDLKDDKSFSYFVVTKEEFPRVVIVRGTTLFSFPAQGRVEKHLLDPDFLTRGLGISFLRERKEEKKKYSHIYGPYPSKQHMEIVLKILRKIFPFHSGSQKTEKGCLYRQIGMCPGPYDGAITKEAYRKNIRSIEYVLRGQKKQLLSVLEKEMQTFAKEENFEQAKILRGQVFALRHIQDIALLTRNPNRVIRNQLDKKQNYVGDIGDSSCKQGVLRVEAYDISNISGDHAVASMVVFENGEPQKNQYRKFKIRSMEGVDDVAMMREVLARRVRHTEWPIPDVIILDGGKGHLNMAVSLWKALGIQIPLVGIAKGPTRKKVDVYTDSALAPHPGVLADTLFLERIREEAHRFAITYHRNVRGKAFLSFMEHKEK